MTESTMAPIEEALLLGLCYWLPPMPKSRRLTIVHIFQDPLFLQGVERWHFWRTRPRSLHIHPDPLLGQCVVRIYGSHGTSFVAHKVGGPADEALVNAQILRTRIITRPKQLLVEPTPLRRVGCMMMLGIILVRDEILIKLHVLRKATT